MNRRDAILFLAALGGAPLVARAQRARVYRVGVILLGGPYRAALTGLTDGLKEMGLEEGKQLIFHVRDLRGDLKLVEATARDLEREQVDLIYALSTSVTLRVKRATKSVPVVFSVGADPVISGLVKSYGQPGGRFTGLYDRFGDLTAKRLELLKVLVPKLRHVAVFYEPGNASAQQSIKNARDAARQLKINLVERPVGSIEELRAALNALRPGEADAICYVSDSMVGSQATLIIETARAKRLPTMFHAQEIVTEGALASYGESFDAIGRLAAKYVQRVLAGAEPANLPVEQIDRLEFVVNLRTAKAIGLAIPESVLARADEILR